MASCNSVKGWKVPEVASFARDTAANFCEHESLPTVPAWWDVQTAGMFSQCQNTGCDHRDLPILGRYSFRNILIYPNPAGDLITISINNTESQTERISFTNAAGQVLFENWIKEGSVIQSVDISDHHVGVYFVNGISKDKVLIFGFHKI